MIRYSDHGPILRSVPNPPAPKRCSEHPAYDEDYCPVCGTTTLIGERQQ